MSILGGHTMEMMQLVRVLTSAYNPRIYVVASTDKMSKDKFLQLEKEANLGGEVCPIFVLRT